ncbi:hypothetical protein [Sarcina ventriculi]|uniref:hypothetical protein n=1 Tax=Sarcina ventriculi TaxID=1267 RepID=UPI001C0FBDDC|nr:hypothetical protein [Sarcina ventriculi]MBU5323636.1 hypothetical protein [Sarcina ventriculi]
MSKFKELKDKSKQSLKGYKFIYALEVLTVLLISVFCNICNNNITGSYIKLYL